MDTARRKTAARTILALGTFASALGGISAVGGACLPDLGAIPGAVLPDVVTIPSSTCGDGIIDTNDDGGLSSEQCDPGEAGVVGCTASCTIDCDGGAIDPMGHCYFAAGTATAYADGEERCLSAGAHLVTVGSEREAAFLGDAGLSAGPYWLGLSFLPTANGFVTPTPPATSTERSPIKEPGWPASGATCAGCFAIGTDVAGRIPAADAGVECVTAADGGWFQRDCGEGAAATVVCEREPPGQRIYFCGGPNCTDLPVTLGTKRYVIPTERLSADQAKAECEGYGPSASIVLLDTREEREQLVRELARRYDPPFSVWIGLVAEDGGTWDDGKAERPAPWADREPAGGGRAYLEIAGSAHFDIQLAHAGGPPDALRLVVCQRR